MYNNETGYFNVALGYNALFQSTGAYQNIAIGVYSLRYNSGNYNTAIGNNTFHGLTTGDNNIAVGHDAASNGTVSGQDNIAIGREALYSLSSGNYNIAIGLQAMNSTTWKTKSIGIGYRALYNSNQDEIVAIGYTAMYSNTTGWHNTGIGYNVAANITTGYRNTALGWQAMNNVTTGYDNTAVGEGAGPTGNFNNTGAFGSGAAPSANNQYRIGNNSVSSIGGQVGWTAFSDKRIKTGIRQNVPGLDFITKLKPVTYHFDIRKENKILGIVDTVEWEGKYDIEKITFSGFLAQDVEQAAREINYDFDGVVPPANSNDLYSIRYSSFVVPLVKAVQELNDKNEKQAALIEQLQQEINQLKTKINRLKQ
jgi:hypothetical protein